METEEYKQINDYIETELAQGYHPKLKKLAEILTLFFSDPQHKTSSKVIIFTQFRDSAKEI